MLRWLSVAATPVAALVLAVPARADDQSYLDYLMSHGFRYHANVETPQRAVEFGRLICDGLRSDGDPHSRIRPKIKGSADSVMIDAARHELCPDVQPLP